MKKIIAVLMCMFLLTLCLVSCGKDNKTEVESSASEVTDATTEDSKDTTTPTDTGEYDTVDEGGIGEAGGEDDEKNWSKPY